MQPVATDVARSVVCLYACDLVTLMYPAKTTKPIEMPFGADSGGPKNNVLDEVVIPQGKGQFRGLSGQLKSIGSLCCGVRNNRDQSLLNSGTTCDAAFRQNSLITC